MDRRTVLSIAGATIGFSGLAAATDESSSRSSKTRAEARNLIEQYQNSEVARETIEEHASDLLDRLAEDEYLEPGALDQLSVVGHRSKMRTQGLEGIQVDALSDDGAGTARLTSTWQMEDHAVQVFVHPETETAYAFVEQTDGSELLVLDGDGEWQDITKQDCTQDGYICESGITCGDTQVRAYERMICFEGGEAHCYKGDEVGCKQAAFTNCKTC